MHSLKGRTSWHECPNDLELALFSLIIGYGGFTRDNAIQQYKGYSAMMCATTIEGGEIWYVDSIYGCGMH